MARQIGLVKLKGTIGDVSFYKSKDGHLARTKGGVDGNRIKTDPAFQRTRENGSEFGRAGKGGKLLRTSLRLLLQNASDKRVTSRLTKELVAVVKTDTVNERGARTLDKGDLTLLQSFEFNANGKLATLLFASYTSTVDRTAGTIKTTVSAFVPSTSIVAPAGTTHFKISAGGSEVDFANETYKFDSKETAVLPWNGTQVAEQTLTATLTANSTLPIFQVLGIEFFQQVNGKMYPLKNGSFNALAIVGVNKP